MLSTFSLFGDFVALIIALCVSLIFFFKWKYQYWAKMGVPYLEPKIPFGTVGSNTDEHIGVQIKGFYNKMKTNGWKHGGIFSLYSPLYIPVDLDYVRNILSKDFKYFTDRGLYHNVKGDPLSGHLFNIEGSRWRNMRAKLTPTFSSGKMKMMFHTLVECEANLQKQMLKEIEKKKPIDIKEVLGCFTTDVIGSCAFGLECKTFDTDDSPFRVYGRKVFMRDFGRQVKRTVVTLFPNLSKLLNVALIPGDVSSFFMDVVKDSIDYREKNNIVRNDFLQLLLDMKNNKDTKDGLTTEEAAAQCFVFFIAGFETSSTTMAFALYELSRNQEIQDKVRKEIRNVLAKHDGKITYEAVQEMKYLNQVIDETLRMHPAGAILVRKCVQDYQIPDTTIQIKKGTRVLVPVLGIHYDPDYYPEPEKFDPDRFNDENKNSRHSFAFIPFGEGPRNCIGMRFGLMQTKVGLISVLKNLKFKVNKKTKEPLQMEKRSFVLAAKGELWLDAEEI